MFYMDFVCFAFVRFRTPGVTKHLPIDDFFSAVWHLGIFFGGKELNFTN